MKKYYNLLRYELKTIVKDPMGIFMLIYPFMMLGIIGFLLPAILERTNTGGAGAMYALLAGFAFALSAGGFIMGALLGFSLLENKDEKTMLSIAVTPITVSGYALFKIAYAYVMAIVCNLIMAAGLKLFASDAYVVGIIRLWDNISYFQIFIFSVVNSLMVRRHSLDDTGACHYQRFSGAPAVCARHSAQFLAG